MKVGFFSPLPPAPTGVAGYSAALLASLAKLGAVEVNREGGINLYHAGNNHLHREIYGRALEQPGVVVLHDGVLHHFLLGTLNREAYVEEFVYNYGEWNRGLAEELWRDRARSGTDPRYFARPMVKRIVAASRAVIVHNPAAARIVREHAPGACVWEIPHLFRPPHLPERAAADAFRTEQGIGPETLLVGLFGHHRETKRLGVTLRAFHRAVEAGARARLLVAGAFVSRTYERALAPQLNDPRVIRTGYLEEAEFWRQAMACDVCVNLRYPSAAETSGVAISMMGVGRAVVFTAGEETARFPPDACLRVEAGPGEEETLAEYIRWLADHREAAAEIGRRAAAHISREHGPEKIARAYWDALCGAAG
jgi:glycosyltransferase involved in cell wall biosynthesis